ncbi:hypothetical protein RFI_29954 [Reticulomyxa filosa]|uniref:Uncharacterized protein n=1 Tax=Reticulomyxa filosa TaxID=46433 RepID=X6M343_RETFI|nr:hypothetical protein RFI_29954 [Reticulomyxa filosa]|eukprot:ETO07440.1 hypothetical protein RFI_29954 [Reticulomyxa filosa]
MSIAPSLMNTYPVIILDTVTNERIPHWVELDHMSDDPFTGNEKNRSLMIWPARRLTDGRRYIVAMRNLYTNSGTSVAVSPAFIALRDNTSSNDPSVNFRRNYFNTQIFNVLAANGVERSTLQLAWDFTVMSTYTQTNAMVYMRDDAFSRIDWSEGGVSYRITSVENDFDSEYIARKVNGLMSVPWYLNHVTPGMDVRLIYEWDNPNQPVYQQNFDVEFELLIPYSVANHSVMGRWVQYGHGLFGNFHEIETTYLKQQSNQYGYIFAGVNWLGMCDEDVPFVSEMILTNLTNFPMVPDRLHQGMLNALYLMKLLMSDNFLNDAALQFDGKQVVDPSLRNYYGNSLGGIMGSVYMTLTTDVIRGTIGVPGFPFPCFCLAAATSLPSKISSKSDTNKTLIASSLSPSWNWLGLDWSPLGIYIYIYVYVYIYIIFFFKKANKQTFIIYIHI